MLDLGRLVFLVVPPVAILAALGRSSLYLRYPALSLMMLFVAVKYAVWAPLIDPGGPPVPDPLYRWVETPVMAFKSLAAIEVARRMMEFSEPRFRRSVFRCAIAFAGVVVCGGLLGIQMRPTDMAAYSYARALIHWALAGGLIALLAYNLVWPWMLTEHPDRQHALLLALLCLAHAVTSSVPIAGDLPVIRELEWASLNAYFRPIRLALWCGWLLLFASRGYQSRHGLLQFPQPFR